MSESRNTTAAGLIYLFLGLLVGAGGVVCMRFGVFAQVTKFPVGALFFGAGGAMFAVGLWVLAHRPPRIKPEVNARPQRPEDETE